MDRYSISIGKTPPPPPKKPKEPKKSKESQSLYRKNFPDDNREREAVLSNLLRSAEGRMRIAAAMTHPLRRRLEYASIARRMFHVEPLPQGVEPIYEVNGESYSMDESGRQVIPTPRSGRDRVTVPLFEIASNPQMPLTLIRERRFELIDRAQDMAFQDINSTEETDVFSILDRATVNNTVNAELTAGNLASIFDSFERNDLRAANLFTSPQGYADMRRHIGRDALDIETHQELMNAGLMGTLFGAQINVSRMIPPGRIYITADPQLTGVIPIRTDLTVLNADSPPNTGFSIFEQIGMACHNPRAVAVIRTSPEEKSEPVQMEEPIIVPRMDRYALLKMLWD